MPSKVSLTSWGEGASLALVDHPSSDSITIKIPYVVDVLLYRPASHPIFSSIVNEVIPNKPIFFKKILQQKKHKKVQLIKKLKLSDY